MVPECYRLQLITAPAARPVSPADVRTWSMNSSQLTGAWHDDVLTDRIKAAVELVEGQIGISLIDTTWSMFLDGFPSWEIGLPRPPWDSITWIKYYDINGTLQTLSSSSYIFDAVGGRLTPTPDESWPSTQVRINAVDIKFVSGYGTAGTDCPAQAREIILEIVEDRLKNRGGMYQIPPGTREKINDLWPGRL